MTSVLIWCLIFQMAEDLKNAPRPAKKQKTVPRARHWCFTDNKCRSEVLASLAGVSEVSPTLPDGVSYIFFSKEEGESKTPHWQGYISFAKQVRMNSVKVALDCKELHLEVARGDTQDNKDYIGHTGEHKDKAGLLAGPWEFGQKPVKRNSKVDWDRIKDQAING